MTSPAPLSHCGIGMRVCGACEVSERARVRQRECALRWKWEWDWELEEEWAGLAWLGQAWLRVLRVCTPPGDFTADA